MAARTVKPLHLVTTCSKCGQPIRDPATETGKVLRRYADRRGVSQSELSRKVGVAPQAINFLFLGRQGDNIYLGMKAARKGLTPLVHRVADELKIPDRVLSEALMQDLMKMAKQTHKGCSTEEVNDLRKRVTQRSRDVLNVSENIVEAV